MAQALFEALAGVAPMDNQTAIAVQSLLESQTIVDAPSGSAQAEEEEEDVFQCGKCKKQFNSLSTFVSHKQTRCMVGKSSAAAATATVAVVTQNTATLPTLSLVTSDPQTMKQNGSQGLMSLPNFSSIPHSPLTQTFGQNMVLSDELSIALSAVEQQPINTLQMANNTIQGTNAFLSSVPTNVKPAISTTSLSPMLASSSLSHPNSAYTNASSYPVSIVTSVVSSTPPEAAPLPAQQFIITTSLPDGAMSSRGIIGTLVNADGAKERRLETIQVVSEPPAVTSQPGNTINLGNQGGNLVAIIHERVGNTAAAPPTLATNQNALPQPPTIVVNKQRRTKTGASALNNVYEEPGADKKKLRCHYCDKAFVKNFDLQQHVRSHTGEKPFQCIVCGRAFAQKSNVKKHMATHKVWPAGLSKSLPDQPPPEVPSESTEKDTAETPDDAVPPVPQKFESEGDKMATGGVAPLITVDNTFICQYCGVKFKTYFLLKSHMVKHKSEQVYKCILRECSLTFKELDSFLEHTKTHEHEMSYRCHMCNKGFPSLYDLGVHQYSHSLYPNQGPKASPRHFRCMKCGVKYASPEALVHHLETETHHYECPHCQKVFTCERYLRRHLPIHVSVGIYECEVCYKRFKTENYLKVHSVTHTDEKPFACELCEAAFNRRDKLNRHMSTHDVNKKYKCPFKAHTGCNKEFNRADKLKAHIITHSGLRPFKCDMCPKYFTRRSNLTEHRRIHQDRYRYVCNSCGRKFQRSQFLLRHQCRVKEKKADEENNTDKESTATPATEQGDEQVKGQGEEEPMNTEDVDDPTKTPYLRNRRKIIKPKKRLITIEPEPSRRRGRPRKGARRVRRIVKRKEPVVTEPGEWQIIITEEQAADPNDPDLMATSTAQVVDGGQVVITEENGGPYCVLQQYVPHDGSNPLEVTLQQTSGDILAASAHAIELDANTETLTYDQAIAYAQLHSVQVNDQNCLVTMGDGGSAAALVVDARDMIEGQQAMLVSANGEQKSVYIEEVKNAEEEAVKAEKEAI